MTNYDDEWIPEEYMGGARIDITDVEVGMYVAILYNSTFGGRVVRDGPVTEVEAIGFRNLRGARIVLSHSEPEDTRAKGFVRGENGALFGAEVFSKSAVRTTCVGRLMAIYRNPESP